MFQSFLALYQYWRPFRLLTVNTVSDSSSYMWSICALWSPKPKVGSNGSQYLPVNSDVHFTQCVRYKRMTLHIINAAFSKPKLCTQYDSQYDVLLLLLSRFSRVLLCATPWTAAHQAPPSLGFSRQEHWSGLPFPSPVCESEKWKWSRSVMSDS